MRTIGKTISAPDDVERVAARLCRGLRSITSDFAHPAVSERRPTIAGRRFAFSNSSMIDPCSLAVC